jgi:glycerol kinase
VILAIDQGTTGTTALVVGDELEPLGRGYSGIRQYFPRPGWVEHDPEEIWQSVLSASDAALHNASIGARDLRAIGIANQRETCIVWERKSGRAIGRAIVWQDRRTAERCRALPSELIRERTGLLPDPYFSATKLQWLLESLPSVEGFAFGTVDSWLLWKLTAGRLHATDVTNASRTMLLNLETIEWDDELLELFDVPRDVLPDVHPSGEVVAETSFFGATLPVAGVAGDQQAALFGHACFAPGQAKATFGTGSFVLVHEGEKTAAKSLPDGLVRTAACSVGEAESEYALEGSIFVTGAAIQWLRDGLGVLEQAEESEALARSVDGNAGIYFVPALTGLGSPHWAPDARGLITGLTRGTTREHLVRAALEAIAYQTYDVLDAIPLRPTVLRADGGASANSFLMQFQADVLGIPVEVSAEREMTALGAAALAGLATGIWRSRNEVATKWRAAARYEPQLDRREAESLLADWRQAVRRALL